MEFWLTPETEESSPGLAKDDEGNLILCDDCPCGCATTYTMVGDLPGLSSGWNVTLTKFTTTPPCGESGTDFWKGLAVGFGGFGFLVNGHLIVVHGDPSTPSSWAYVAYGNATGCGVDMIGNIVTGNSCPNGSYSGTGPARASTAVIS